VVERKFHVIFEGRYHRYTVTASHTALQQQTRPTVARVELLEFISFVATPESAFFIDGLYRELEVTANTVHVLGAVEDEQQAAV